MTTLLNEAGARDDAAPATENAQADVALAGLLAELKEIAADRAMAARFIGRGSWLTELSKEARGVRNGIQKILADSTSHLVSSANTRGGRR